MLTLALQQRDSRPEGKGGEALEHPLETTDVLREVREFQQKKEKSCFSECGTKIYKGPAIPQRRARQKAEGCW